MRLIDADKLIEMYPNCNGLKQKVNAMQTIDVYRTFDVDELYTNPKFVYVEVIGNPESNAYGILVQNSYYEMSDGTVMPLFSEQMKDQSFYDVFGDKVIVWSIDPKIIHFKE